MLPDNFYDVAGCLSDHNVGQFLDYPKFRQRSCDIVFTRILIGITRSLLLYIVLG